MQLLRFMLKAQRFSEEENCDAPG